MKIKMIGTGAISVKERSSCTLVDDRILIDCGNGIVKTLIEQNVDIAKIEVLLITHLHGDHFLDIPFLIMQRSFSAVSNQLNIYCPKGTEDIIAKLFGIAYSDLSDWKILRDKARVSFLEFDTLNSEEVIEGYFVDSYEMVHGSFKPAYGYVIKNSNKTIGISGDASYCPNVDKLLEKSDVAVLDMSFVDSSDKHMGLQDIVMLTEKYNKPIIATHMSKGVRECVLQNKIQNLIIPNDGDEFEV